jgi:hypothetical protein
MLDAAFIFGVLCAAAGALAGNRTAWVLLLTAVAGLALNETAVPFDLKLWLALDGAAILAIIWPPRALRRDWSVLVLFVPLWLTYFVPSQAGYAASVLVAALQMALTLPAKRLARRWRHTAVNHHTWSDFDFRVSHGEA